MSEQQEIQQNVAENTVEKQPVANRVNPPIKEVIAYLAEKFPLCFSVEGEAKPLKIGIFQDLAEALSDDDTVSKTQLRQVLRVYTTSWRYLHGVKANVMRVGLQGEEAGVVDEQQAEHAAQTLAAAKEAVAARRAEERKAQRKEFFKKQRAEAKSTKAKKPNVAKAKNDAPKATEESLAALANKFSR